MARNIIGSIEGQGIVGIANFVPTANPYLAGDIMGAAQKVDFSDRNGYLVPEGSLIRIISTVMKIDVAAVPAGQTSYTGRLYSVTPPSARADNDAWTLASGDLAAYRGSISFGVPVDEGGCLYVKNTSLDVDVKLDDKLSSLYMELITDGAHTPAAVARQCLIYGYVI